MLTQTSPLFLPFQVPFTSSKFILLVIALFTLSGCASSSMSCNQVATLNWADTNQITQDIAALTSDEFAGRKTGSEGALKTQQYLAKRYQEIGLIPWQNQTSFLVPFTYDYQFSSANGVNVIGVIPSQNISNRWRIITAHYDHLGKQGRRIYHGADDNASGVAGMLAIAKEWQASSHADINLMIVATDAEENGLYGGYALVEQLSAQADMQIEFAMNLDMIGHPSRPKAIYAEGDRNFTDFDALKNQLSQQHLLCIRTSYSSLQSNGLNRVNWLKASDHYAFHKAKIPWIYFGVPPHSQYHTVDDTLDTLDIEFIGQVSEMAFSLINQDQLALKQYKN